MNQPLSPAAQAVVDAANGACSYGADDVLNDSRQIAAAALRVVADQVVPAASPRDRATWSPFAGQIRAEILAIAAELKGATTTTTTTTTDQPC